MKVDEGIVNFMSYAVQARDVIWLLKPQQAPTGKSISEM